MRNIRSLAGQVALALGAALAAGCATNPATGDLDVVLMSEGKEIEIGREAHEEMMAGGAAYDDAALQAYVNRIGQQLAANSDRPDIEYTFTVVDADGINAFALPGGFIYINRGLLAYLDNQQEMAAVLSHEIGHVTARHAVRQKTATSTNEALATVVGVATRNADLYQASRQYGTEIVRGYGREMELEADGEGAQYLHASGYDPNAMLDVIGVLKDHETYQRARARETGRPTQSYHGLYATHPRNDQRLQQVIRAAAELEPVNLNPVDATEYRKVTEGLAYGQSSAPPQREDDRFYQNKLGFTFAIPENWSTEQSSRVIVTRKDDDTARVMLGLQRAPEEGSFRDFLAGATGEPILYQGEALQQEGLEGYTAVAPGGNGKNRRRLAVLKRGSIAYLFEGQVADDGDFATADAEFTALIKSFRPMKPEERSAGPRQYISWVQVQPGETFASIARGVRLPDAENELRLMNGYYPRGEPRAGDWIKIVKTER
ncbi:MAG: M48 family metalloprotease [Halieaceae bacterium]|nr:M48 family metalloprotease [Halieaceae bacterium]